MPSGLWHTVCFHFQSVHLTQRAEHPMSQASRSIKSQPEDLPADVLELAGALAQLPPEQRARIEPLFERVLESTKRRRRILGLVQDALSQLRLDMKYLMFDLEATRRERDEFRRKIEEA
jgi:predicted component of type VI protein secretion system